MKAVLSPLWRTHAEELDGVHSGRDREIRRLGKGRVASVLGGRDQTDLRVPSTSTSICWLWV